MLRNFYVCVFRARFKTAVTPSLIGAFFLLAAVLLGLGMLFNQNNGLSLRVGLLTPEASIASDWDMAVVQRVLRGIEYYGRDDCEIILYTDEALLTQDVAAHKLECGYAFHTEGMIRAYRSPMTVADKVLDLLVAAAYLETVAGELGAETLTPYLIDMEGVDTADMAADIQSRADEYLRDGALMDIIVEDGIAVENAAAPAPYRRLFHGLAGLFALLLALLCAMGLSGDMQKAALARIVSTGRGEAGYHLAGFGVIFTVTGLFFLLAVPAGECLYPGLSVGWRVETLMGLAYILAVSSSCLCLSVYMRASLFPALLTFIFIFAALLGGVIFDLREVMASVAFLRFFFPNYYYIDGITRAAASLPWRQAVLLCGVGMVTGALALKKRGVN